MNLAHSNDSIKAILRKDGARRKHYFCGRPPEALARGRAKWLAAQRGMRLVLATAAVATCEGEPQTPCPEVQSPAFP